MGMGVEKDWIARDSTEGAERETEQQCSNDVARCEGSARPLLGHTLEAFIGGFAGRVALGGNAEN
jgi:hypothetical protein